MFKQGEIDVQCLRRGPEKLFWAALLANLKENQ
jgi:hypothetical protein